MITTKRGVFIAVAALVLLLLLAPMAVGGMMRTGMMGPGMGPWMMPGYGPPAGTSSGWHWSLGMGWGWLTMLAIWGVVVLAIALVAAWLGGNRSPGAADSALEILRRRFAAGELTPEQFAAMRRALEGPA